MKKRAGDIYKRTPYMEFQKDWSFGLSAMLDDGRKIKNYFLFSRIFSGKADSAILLGFESTINP